MAGSRCTNNFGRYLRSCCHFALAFRCSTVPVFAAKDFNINNNTRNFFHVDGTTGNVGIGTITPQGGFVVTNSPQARFVVASGNVGIGSVWPGVALDVSGTVRATAFSGDGSALSGISAGGFTDEGTNYYCTTGLDFR